MPLSEYEQRVLEQMERSLSGDRFISEEPPRRRPPHNGLRYLLVIVATLVGLTLALIGAMSGYVWVGIAGFLIMLTAVISVFGRPQREVGPGAASSSTLPGKSKSAKSASLMSRFEDRWERRNNGRS